jgi:predicted acyltransferase
MVVTMTANTEKSNRLISVDVFRGATIIGMILVNVQGEHGLATFRHCAWNGVHFADLIFPFFLFIVGVSIVLSLSQLHGNPGKKTWLKVLWRTAKLLIIGIALNTLSGLVYHDSGIRFMGVLQRIGLVYLACVVIFFYLNTRQQLILGAFLLIFYWLAMMLVPIPSVGSGILEPGRNIAAWIDSFLVPGRMFQGTWDPEGFFSTIPAIATGISGLLAGYLLRSGKSAESKIIYLFFFGFVMFAVGNIWDTIFPCNKHIWTSSFVMYTSGLALLTLASFIWLIDVRGFNRWFKIGVVFGMNAIFAYIFHELLILVTCLPVYHGASVNSLTISTLERFFSPDLSSLLYLAGFVFVCYGMVYFLYIRKIFIKL